MIIKTQSGSTYEIDESNKLARRLHGVKTPTKFFSKDEQWKKYSFISEVVIGIPLIIAWEETVEGYTQPATQTSLVVEINPTLN